MAPLQFFLGSRNASFKATHNGCWRSGDREDPVYTYPLGGISWLEPTLWTTIGWCFAAPVSGKFSEEVFEGRENQLNNSRARMSGILY